MSYLKVLQNVINIKYSPAPAKVFVERGFKNWKSSVQIKIVLSVLLSLK